MTVAQRTVMIVVAVLIVLLVVFTLNTDVTDFFERLNTPG